MSGFNYPPPSVISSTYNPAWFASSSSSITLAEAQSMFYSIYGGTLFGSITLQGNVIGSGTSTISGFSTISQSGVYTNTNTTDSTSLITGSIITSGGLAVAKSIYCSAETIVNGTSQITLNSSSNSSGRSTIAFTNDSSTFELGLRGTTNGTFNNEMYIYAGGSYLWHMNVLGWQYLLSTQDASSSSIGGALTVSGGVGIAKKLYVGSNCFLGTGSAGGVCVGTSTDTARMISCLNSNLSIAGSNYITLGQGNSNNNQAELSFYYAGAGSSSNKFQVGFFGGSRLVELAAGGTLTINSGIASTTQSNGSLVVVGGIGVSGSINTGGSINAGTSINATTSLNSATGTIGSTSNTGGTLSITSVGYHEALYYNSTNYTLINVGSSGNYIINPQTGATTTSYTFTPDGYMQLSGLIPRNSHKLDLGTNTSKDNLICLAQTNSSSPSYMIGVSGSSLNYTSGSAHTWFSNTSTTPAITGTQNMALTQQGSLILNNSGYHAYGSDITSLSSINAVGMHMQVPSSVGTLLAYNYSTSTYADMNIQSSLYYKSSNGFWGVGTNNPGCPLEVNGTGNQSTAAGFTFITSSATGQAVGFTNRAFSLKTSGGIMVASGELDCLSDLRLKENVVDLNQDLADRFIRKINPIEYSYSANPNKRHYGYGAQHLMREGLDVMVGSCDADDPLPEEIIECTDGSVIKLHSDSRLVVDILSCLPMIHKVLQNALIRIDELVQICGKQQMQINELVDSKPARRAKKTISHD